MSTRTATDDDEGKPVVNAEGEQIGVVAAVRQGTAYVDPDPTITDQITSKLGWADVDEDHYPLDETKIETITVDEIRLREAV
jgi:hypothetical protein